MKELFHELLLTFGTAMVPVLELRGAIPVGVAAGLPPAVACVVAILGNLVPVPLIMLLVRRVFDWLRHTAFFGPKIEWLEKRAHLKGRIVRKGYNRIRLIVHGRRNPYQISGITGKMPHCGSGGNDWQQLTEAISEIFVLSHILTTANPRLPTGSSK